MFNAALQFLLESVFGLFVFAGLVRFYLQAFRAPYRNPLTEFVVALTDWAVRPLRRFVPGLYGLDLSSFVFAWGLETILQLLSWALRGVAVFTGGPHVVPVLLMLALVILLRHSIYLLLGAVIVQAILSWVNPYSQFAPLLDSVTKPILRPIRKFLPPIGGFDLSPLVVFILAQLLLMLPLAALERYIGKML